MTDHDQAGVISSMPPLSDHGHKELHVAEVTCSLARRGHDSGSRARAQAATATAQPSFIFHVPRGGSVGGGGSSSSSSHRLLPGSSYSENEAGKDSVAAAHDGRRDETRYDSGTPGLGRQLLLRRSSALSPSSNFSLSFVCNAVCRVLAGSHAHLQRGNSSP